VIAKVSEPLRLWVGVAAARLLRWVSGRFGRTGGTTAPGRVLLAIAPNALSSLGKRLDRGCAVISATNGKTTTASMVAAILEGRGDRVVHNRAGSNMHWGVATALLDAAKGHGQLGLFEVDEAWVKHIADSLDPKAFLLSNLFRDQLDRYGELETLAELWADVVSTHGSGSDFVFNADDPLLADLGSHCDGALYFGLEDKSLGLDALQHAADSKTCRNCGAAYYYEFSYLGHLGHYHCPGCGRGRPTPNIAASRVVLKGMSGSYVEIKAPAASLEVNLPLPGLYNVYNALAAAALSLQLEATPQQVQTGLERIGAAFGRVETISIQDRPVSILLVKNPTGANEVLRTLTLEQNFLDVWIALNDNTADGRDISWIWDADFEILAGHLRRVTCSGTRAEEMALRLKYAGVSAPISIERDLGTSLDAAVADRDGSDNVALYALPTYTALLELRHLLTRRGIAKRWSE
jgi:lipid II isoglutaminyl synthase (glutamine-hydrolysing)